MRRTAAAPLAIFLAAAALACKPADLNQKDGGSGPAPPGLPGLDGPSTNRPEVRGVDPDAACATATVRAELLPLDLYLMLDASYSMGDEASPGVRKWDAIVAALGRFLSDPQSAGISVGLQIFPVVDKAAPEDCFANSDCGMFGPCRIARACSPSGGVEIRCSSNAQCSGGATCQPLLGCTLSAHLCETFGAACGGGVNGTPDGNRCAYIPGYCEQRDVCREADYATPLVPIAPLPGAAAPIMTALGQRRPDGLTPLFPALAGALSHTRARRRQARMSNDQRKIAVVLGSDARPSSCSPLRIEDVLDLARVGAAEPDGVPTFAVGVVDPKDKDISIENLEALAAAGRTGRPFVINAAPGADVGKEFQQALTDIRSTLACEYKLPPPPPGRGSLDLMQVNVVVTSRDGSTTAIGNVSGRAACDPVRGGWYYNVPLGAAGGEAPTSIVACEATCQGARRDSGAEIKVVLGCATLVE